MSNDGMSEWYGANAVEGNCRTVEAISRYILGGNEGHQKNAKSG
jgi:hypothetical protein